MLLILAKHRDQVATARSRYRKHGGGSSDTTDAGETTPATPTIFAADHFTRTDQKIHGVTPQTGPAWVDLTNPHVINTSLTLGVDDSAVRCAYIDSSNGGANSGAADGNLAAKISRLGAGGIAFRIVDSSNFLMVCPWPADKVSLHRYTAGVRTQLGTDASAASIGDTVTVVLSGTSIVVKRNAATVITTTSAQGQTSTLHGWGSFDVGSGMDDYQHDNF